MRFSYKLTDTSEWHRWFAWRPIFHMNYTTKTVYVTWLQDIERRCRWGCYEYREIEKEEVSQSE